MTLGGRLRVSLAHPRNCFQDRQKTDPIKPSWCRVYNVLLIKHINECMQELECSRNENAPGFLCLFQIKIYQPAYSLNANEEPNKC